MPTLFSDLVNRLRDEVNKGDSIPDSVLKTRLQNAVFFIEKNTSLRYMEAVKYTDPEWGESASYPYTVELPDNIRSIRKVRVVQYGRNGDHMFSYLSKCEPEDLQGQGRGWPSHYATEGYKHLWLDSIPGEAYRLEYLLELYSGRFVDSSTTWLFEYGEELIIAQAMVFLAPFLRAPEITQLYGPMVEMELKVLLNADEEFKWAGSDNRWGGDRNEETTTATYRRGWRA